MVDLKARLTSRKFWLTVATIVVPLLPPVHLTPGEKARILSIAGPVFVVVEGFVDFIRAQKAGPVDLSAILTALGLRATAGNAGAAFSPPQTIVQPPAAIYVQQTPPAGQDPQAPDVGPPAGPDDPPPA